MMRPGNWSRDITTDPATGRVTLTLRDDTGDTAEPHGLTHGETVEERWEIHLDDPLSARATIRREQRLSRGDWSVRTVVETGMAGHLTQLRMSARVTAWEAETQVFANGYEKKGAARKRPRL